MTSSLEELDSRLRTVLPEEYQDSYEDVQPVSMGSAGLKYAGDGTVAWDQMWGSFCDLAMAGGPPHKGALLEPGLRTEVKAQSDRYREVVDEICRGVTMVTDLSSNTSSTPGWVSVDCYSEGMAAWLLRAITMENVAVRAEGRTLELPAAPGFRLEKEIKNVITVIAKTCHYWLGHIPRSQKVDIANLFAALAVESPLAEPAFSDDGLRAHGDAPLFDAMAERIHRDTGLRSSSHQYAGWLGLECPSVPGAVWMMRALVVSNVLSRREGTVLFVPVNPNSDPHGDTVVESVVRIHALAVARGVV
jgi:sirohydrochlorin cobaltochelatase